MEKEYPGIRMKTTAQKAILCFLMSKVFCVAKLHAFMPLRSLFIAGTVGLFIVSSPQVTHPYGDLLSRSRAVKVDVGILVELFGGQAKLVFLHVFIRMEQYTGQTNKTSN